jgi:hypothetical protein
MMEEIMRKHSKFITILLSALLAVCLVQTVFVQAFATEMGDDDFGWGNASTSDEAETVYPVSMEVVKAPESVTVNNGRITDSTFWSNVVLHIVYSNGEEYDVNCDGIDSEDGIVPPIAEIDGYKGKIYYGTNSENEDTISFYIAYDYAEDDGVTCIVSADFSAEKKVDPHTIVRYELTKLPDMVFTKPLFTGSRDDISSGEEWNEWMNSLDVNNSISNHIDGMEITYYYANGEKRSVVVNSSNLKSIALMPWFAIYRVENYGECVDEYGNYLVFQVDDLGDYKFSVSLGSSDTEMIYTAKSVDNPNPSIKPVSTEDTPAKPEKPSGNISSATSDVATNDNAGNNNSTNGTANNSVVATGNFATPAIITVVMLSAVAVMFVFKRKRMF